MMNKPQTLKESMNPKGPGLLISNYEYPNPKKHKIISFIKSGVRILGYIFLFVNIPVAAYILIGSEVIGIIEELV